MFDELQSDEELTSYQLPQDERCDEINTPASPPILSVLMPSSLRSSIRRNPSVLETISRDEPQDITNGVGSSDYIKSGPFQTLGMAENDISWASSMESSLVEKSPRTDFNTAEKATFLPGPAHCHGSQIQPRALFCASSSESLGLKPLDRSYDSDDVNPYSGAVRLSDVCDVLNTLHVKSSGSDLKSSEVLREDRFDFDVQGTLGSPSLFSPKNSQKIRDTYCLSQSKNIEENEFYFKKEPSTPILDKSPTSDMSPVHCSSPSVFSPVTKVQLRPSDARIKITKSNLSPIPEPNTTEDSALEVTLETSKHRDRSSTPVKNSSQLEKVLPDNIQQSSSVLNDKKKAAKCLNYEDPPVPELFSDDSRHLQPEARDNKKLDKLFKSKLKKGKKLLYGSSANVKPFEMDENDMFRSLIDSENLNSDFMNTKTNQINILPKSNGLVSFNTLIEDLGVASSTLHSLKRFSSKTDLSSPKKMKMENNSSVNTSKISYPDTCDIVSVHQNPEASWVLTDTQADVTDSQICQAMEDIETTLAAQLPDESANRPSAIKRFKKKKGKAKSQSVEIEHDIDKNEANTYRHSEDIPEVLVGFRTGTNKIINPSETSLNQVRKIFDDCNDVAISSEPAEISFKESSGNDIRKTKLGYDNKTCKIKKPSVNSLARARQIFNDGEVSNKQENQNCPEFKGFRTGNKKLIEPTQESLAKVKSIFMEEENCMLSDGKITGNVESVAFMGFKTGNSKTIIPSEKSLKKVEKLFNDVDEELEFKDSGDIIMERSSKEKHTDGFVGFRTGNDKLINPSVDSLMRVKKLFQEDEKLENTESYIGFKTGNNKLITPSEISLKRGKRLLKETLDVEETTASPEEQGGVEEELFESSNGKIKVDKDIFVGFKTGNKKSGDSLARVKIILKEDQCEEIAADSKSFVALKTGNKKTVFPSCAQQEKVKNLSNDFGHEFKAEDHADITKTRKLKEESDDCFLGFRTGNEKLITPSEASLARVKGMFKEDEKTNRPPDNISFVDFKTGNNQAIKPSEEALKKMKNLFDDAEENANNTSYSKRSQAVAVNESFVGFKTGNNQAIFPSEEALKKVKTLFDDAEENDNKTSSLDKSRAVAVNESFAGFKTGNNQAIFPSEEALKKVKHLFEDAGENANNTSDLKRSQAVAVNESFVGFKTGNNQAIFPSEDALKKVKHLFEDAGEIDNKTSFLDKSRAVAVNESFVGFKTGNNQAFFPSEDALKKVKNLFDDAGENDNKTSCFEESRVVALNEMKESSEKLTKVLSDTENIANMRKSTENVVLGFRSGSNKTMKPSNHSLDRVKGLFDNIFCEEELHPHSSTSQLSEENGKLFKKPMESKCKNSLSLHKNREEFSGLPSKESPLEVKSMNANLSEPLKPVETQIEHPSATSDKDTDVDGKKEGESKNISVQQQTVLNESYSTLLENTDWDESIVPSWFLSQNSSDFKAEECNSQNHTTAIKRPCSPGESSMPSKKRKQENNDVFQKRSQARVAQERQGSKEKGKVQAMLGSHLQRRRIDKLMRWKDALPEGPQYIDSDQLRAFGVKDNVIAVTPDNAKDFTFVAQHFFSQEACESNTNGLPVGDCFLLILNDSHCAGVVEIERAFFAGPGVAPELVPNGWVAHHYGMLVWKLACYERSCARRLAGIALTPHNLMLQLKYRYDREIDRSESSALKRILERDDSAGKSLVLTVMKVKKLVEGLELLLTDGWYTCPARTDVALIAAANSGKIREGTKIITQGAELIGCEQGVPPLEIPAGVYLKLATNSTRRVRWFQKMGFQRLGPLTIPLTSILPCGGSVCCTKIVVVRAYPLVFMEKTSDGLNVTRNTRAEEKAARLFKQEQESRMEELYSQVQKEIFSNSTKSVRLKEVPDKLLAEISNPEELCRILENSENPGRLEALLSMDQKSAVYNFQESRRMRAGREIQEKMQAAHMHVRSVRSVLRVRVMDWSAGDDKTALLSWWQPADDLISLFQEGKAFNLFNVTCGNSKSQQLYLNSGRQSRVEPIESPKRCLPLRTVLNVSDITLSLSPSLGELDVVGLVVYVHQVKPGPKTLQTVYLTDNGDRFFGLVFWRGLQEFCCEDTLAEGLVVSASNVQWRRASAHGVFPCGYVSETTLFVHNSKSSLIQKALEDLKEELEDEDIPSLIERCQEKISAQLQMSKNRSLSLNASVCNSTAATDVTLNTSIDTATSHMSPHPRPQYLNGFAQKPRAASTPVKPSSPLHWKLEKLSKVGEPPPLSPIPMSTNSSHGNKRWSRPFKLPAIADESPSVDL